MTATLALAPTPSPAETVQVLARLRTRLDARLDFLEALDVRDQATTVVAYARAARLGLELANEAAEVRLRAERHAGGLLHALLVSGPHRKRHDGVVRARRALPNGVLKDAGITAQQSSNWMAISRIPAPEFEQRVQATKDARRQLTSAAFVRASRQFLRQAGRGGNGQASPTANALRKALVLLREVHDVRGSVELNLASGISSIVVGWDLNVAGAGNIDHAVPAGVARDVTCLLCGRLQPPTKPAKCPACGGAWVTS